MLHKNLRSVFRYDYQFLKNTFLDIRISGWLNKKAYEIFVNAVIYKYKLMSFYRYSRCMQ